MGLAITIVVIITWPRHCLLHDGVTMLYTEENQKSHVIVGMEKWRELHQRG